MMEGLLPIVRIKWESLDYYWDKQIIHLKKNQYVIIPIGENTRPNNQLLYRDLFRLLTKVTAPTGKRVSYYYKLRGVYNEKMDQHGIQVYRVR